jgi:hypothetical protein
LAERVRGTHEAAGSNPAGSIGDDARSGRALQALLNRVRHPASPPGCSSEAERAVRDREGGLSRCPIPTTGHSSAAERVPGGHEGGGPVPHVPTVVWRNGRGHTLRGADRVRSRGPLHAPLAQWHCTWLLPRGFSVRIRGGVLITGWLLVSNLDSESRPRWSDSSPGSCRTRLWPRVCTAGGPDRHRTAALSQLAAPVGNGVMAACAPLKR